MLLQLVVHDGDAIFVIDRVLPSICTEAQRLLWPPAKVNARQERSAIGTCLRGVKSTAGRRRRGLVEVIVLMDKEHTASGN